MSCCITDSQLSGPPSLSLLTLHQLQPLSVDVSLTPHKGTHSTHDDNNPVRQNCTLLSLTTPSEVSQTNLPANGYGFHRKLVCSQSL